MNAQDWAGVAGVVDVARFYGADADTQAVPDVVIEVAHGATRRAHFDELRAQLRGKSFPADLVDFFFVNTDVGAPEAALALARAIVAAEPKRSVIVLRCLIPRTFIDCNRIIDEATRPTARQREAAGEAPAPSRPREATASPMASTQQAGGMTPGVVRYVDDADDLALLFKLYASYRATVTRVFESVVGAGGVAVLLHSYAPRTVDVQVDEKIVQSLHAAYAPDKAETWPLRAEVDLITRTPEGTLLADADLVAAVRQAFESAGHGVTESGTYPLHPSSLAHTFATRWPRQLLCLELRRDLLVDKFTPFQEMLGDEAKCARMAGLLASGLVQWLRARAGT